MSVILSLLFVVIAGILVYISVAWGWFLTCIVSYAVIVRFISVGAEKRYLGSLFGSGEAYMRSNVILIVIAIISYVFRLVCG